MDSHVQHLIDELLEIDPTLANREDFSRTVEMMASLRPRVRLRHDFQRELRAEILTLATKKKGFSFSWLSFKNISYFSTGLAFAAFAIFAFRQLDFFPTKHESVSTASYMMQTPALGGATNRALPESTLKSSDSAENSDMAAVKNISPKILPTQQNTQQKQAPKKETPTTPQTFARLATPESTPAEDKAEAPQSLMMLPPSTNSAESEGLSAGNPMADTATPPLGASAKIAASAVRFAFSGDLPTIEPMQSVTITSSINTNSQDFPTKSIEVIRDDIARGGYYKDDFAFDGIVRNLEKPRIETINITKGTETYTLKALILDVANASENGPKTITIVLSEGF